ncbi:MAG: dethiobiotin synthase [bacterium]
MKGIFVTGTDTGVGKTVIAGLLAGAFSRYGRVITQKWVQTGCIGNSTDIDVHNSLSGISVDNELTASVNPYCFTLAASPHLAAESEGGVIDPERIKSAYHELANQFDYVFAEGAGGILVPLTRSKMIIDIVAELSIPVVIVVENKIGCVNHALLTIEALHHRNIPIAGLIFNQKQLNILDNHIVEDNPRIINQISNVPVLGKMPYLKDLNEGKAAIETIAKNLYFRIE